MSEEAGQYQAEFVGKAQGVAVGAGNVIYNYFYASSAPEPAKTEADDGVDLPCPYPVSYTHLRAHETNDLISYAGLCLK